MKPPPAEDRARANLLEELVDLERAATPGPWTASEVVGGWPYISAVDAALAAAARNALPALIAAAEALADILGLMEDANVPYERLKVASIARAALRGVVGEPADAPVPGAEGGET